MKRWIKKPAVFIPFILIVLILALVFFYTTKSKQSQYDIFVAKRTEVVQEVGVTGKTEPVESVALSFEKAGRVIRVHADVGDRVSANQALIELDSTELSAQLAESQARGDVERAKLAELKSGARPEDIDIKRAELEKARQDLVNKYDGVLDMLGDAYTKADDAVRAKTAAMFNYLGSSYILTFSSCAGQAEIDASGMRLASNTKLDTWAAELNLLNSLSSRDALDQALVRAKENLAFFKDFLERANSLLITGCTLNDSRYDSYRTNVNTGRNNIVTALTNVSNLEQSIASERRTVERVESELTLKLAGARAEEIAAQEAQLREAEAKVDLIRAQLAKTVLRSPINGIVTKQDAKIGEIVSASANIVSLISESQFEITANVPEADIAKIKVGDGARVTLDAYGPDIIFEVHVSKIDPAETIIEGVATYKTTLQFNQEDERIKSGMTANIDILGARRENVIVVPQRAVITKNGDKIARILTADGTILEARVLIGLRGSDGMFEIVSGVSEGDKVVVSTKED